MELLLNGRYNCSRKRNGVFLLKLLNFYVFFHYSFPIELITFKVTQKTANFWKIYALLLVQKFQAFSGDKQIDVVP